MSVVIKSLGSSASLNDVGELQGGDAHAPLKEVAAQGSGTRHTRQKPRHEGGHVGVTSPVKRVENEVVDQLGGVGRGGAVAGSGWLLPT